MSRASKPRVRPPRRLKDVSLTQTGLAAFPATMKSHGPGLITLTPTSLFFTSLLSPQPVMTLQLADITGVKKITMTKGLEVRYSHQDEHGAVEEKDVSFQLVGGRSELFARLVSSGGKRWAKM